MALGLIDGVGALAGSLAGLIPNKSAERAADQQAQLDFMAAMNADEQAERNAEIAKYAVIAFGSIAALIAIWFIIKSLRK